MSSRSIVKCPALSLLKHIERQAATLNKPHLECSRCLRRRHDKECSGQETAHLHVVLKGGLLCFREEALPRQLVCPVITQACWMQPCQRLHTEGIIVNVLCLYTSSKDGLDNPSHMHIR